MTLPVPGVEELMGYASSNLYSSLLAGLTFNPLDSRVTNINFLLTTSIHNQKKRLWEVIITQSPGKKCFDSFNKFSQLIDQSGKSSYAHLHLYRSRPCAHLWSSCSCGGMSTGSFSWTGAGNQSFIQADPHTNSPDWSPYISFKNSWENLLEDQSVLPI